MPDKSITIEIEGLKQFRNELKAIDKELVKELGREYKTIGTLIAGKAASKAAGLGGVAAKSAQAIKATARTTDVAVKIDAQHFPYALGAEFGGGKPRTPQFKPWRGNNADAGYFLYPTIREESAHIVDAFDKVMERVTAKAFPNR